MKVRNQPKLRIFKHVFHKRKSLYMLPKGKCICMLKRKFCVASFWSLTIVILFVFVFFSFTKTCLNMILWNIGIICFIIELHQFTSGTPYIPQKRQQNLQIWSLYHSRDRIVAASRPLQIYTESANPIGVVIHSRRFDF
jgi:hypothetical protein